MLKIISDFKPFGVERLQCNPSLLESRFYDDGMEIDWLNNEIIWSKNRCLLHHLTMSAKIKDAVICTVDTTRYLAVLYEGGLTLFSFSGQAYMIPLPFPISRIFALHKAILLVRAQCSSFLQNQFSDFPILFTLFHPLEEIRPVAFNDTLSKQFHPKFTTIMSPSPRRNHQVPLKTEDTLCFITDNNFMPLHVSNERVYMVAKTNDVATVYKFIEPTSSRELLFSSPHFRRSPSIFSPPRPYTGLSSPGTDARNEIQATLEGIPPDLFIESLYDFKFNTDTEYSSFCEISDGSRKYLLFVHEGVLDAVDISYVDTYKTSRWMTNIHQVLYYDQLMYFVVDDAGNLSLFEENRMIAHLPTAHVVGIHKLGKRFILDYQNGERQLVTINITVDKLISQVLGVAHFSISKDNYATTILALSECGALSDQQIFFDCLLNLLVNIEDESELINFFTALHLLSEDMKIRIGCEDERKRLMVLLIRLAKRVGMVNHLLYYALSSEEEITLEDCVKNDKFGDTDVHDLINWCAQCISGKALVEIPSPFQLSQKVIKVFGSIHTAEDAKTIVVLSEREKLTLSQIVNLQPALCAPLLRIFQLTRDSPPEDWPIAAYRLIGRDDIAKLHEYIKQPFDNLNSPQASLPDLRFLEVERLLQSHLPVTIDVERPNGTDDIVYQSMMVGKLRILLEKQWSLSIGRGMFNLKSMNPLPSQKLVPEKLNKVGYTTNGTEIVDTDDAAQQQAENVAAQTWAQFNNGVSDGLRVCDAGHSWIVDTISKEYTPYSAGILYGFAINGLLKKLWKVDIFQYLTSPDIKEINAIAMVFGLGVSYRGTKDLGISHLLTMHIPELRQFQQSDYEMSSLIKSAAIFGIGLLFEGSANRHLTEVFAQLLEKSAIFDLTTLPLSLGSAIGLISLGMGDKSPVLKETRERLCIILDGSKTADVSNDKIATFGNSDFFAIAPAAIFVLALGYMRTGHKRVQSALELPADSNFINKMIPDVVLLRTCANLLVDPSPESALNFIVPDGLEPDILASLVTGFAIACGIKFAGTMLDKAYDRLMTIAKCLALFNKTPFDFTDCTTLHREVCLCNVILATSFIVAGTCDAGFLRFVRLIRRRPCMTSQQLFVSGQQAALAMAVGTLNLGKGRFTLGRTNQASAMLLLAAYPRIARSCGDNENSLQTMRHLINAAAVPRVLEVRDVDTDDIVDMKITLKLKDGVPFKIHTPHVLPPFEDINEMIVEDDRFYKVHFTKIPFEDESIRPILWVKKRSETQSYGECDSENLRAIFKMKTNKIFDFSTTDRDEMIRVQHEVEFDNNADAIVKYFRETDSANRLKILHENPSVRKFIKFYGISPAISITEIGICDDDALAFLVPFMTPEEVGQAV